MSYIVNINFININSENFFNSQNSKIFVSLNNNSGYNEYSNEYYVKFNYIDNTIIKKYYIQIFGINIELLNTNSFILNISSFNFTYGYYKEESVKSLILYNFDNFYQLIYLGLPNLKDQVNISMSYNYFLIETTYEPVQPSYLDYKSIMMLNNYQGTINYLQNTIFLNGMIYKINKISINDINDSSNNNYKLFKINDNINLDLDTHIYFNNDIRAFSYILYLNSYNFSEYKIFPENYETIILMIDYIFLPEDINYKNTKTDKYFYKKDSNGNEEQIFFEPIDEIKYSIVLSLNLQTFNSTELKINDEDKYYNVLFFKNYINENYFVKSITIFDYDYIKYFNSNTEFYNIIDININIDLYDRIIKNDNNLKEPIIPEINYSYLFINFDLINLLNLINFNCENNNFHNFMKSNKISVDTLVNYLSNFELKSDNIYYIANNNKTLINDKNLNINSESLIYNYNYLYNNSEKNFGKNKINKGIINFNNNIINCIKCKIVFLFKEIGSYSFYGKIFLDNYNIQIYHKKYDLDNLEKKKKLLNLLLYIASASLGIKIIFYNNLDSEPRVSSFFNYYLNTNPYYLFNEINLAKNLNNYNIYFNIDTTNKNYNQQYLKLNIDIKLDYYILFLYSDKNSVLKNYEELVFNYSQYIFKIFKITDINGNIYENKDIFYIAFNSLKQINLFLEYLNSGLFITNNTKLSNYFNIQKSVTFSNYYNINNYWVLDSLPEPQVPNGNPDILLKNKIVFSINNLHINQIYLQGDLFIEEFL